MLFLLLISGPRRGIESITLKIFNIMWCGGLAFSNLGLFELYTPSVDTNILYIISIIIFNVTYRCTRVRKERDLLDIDENGGVGVDILSIHLKYLIFANIIILGICLPFIPKAWALYNMHGLSYLRGLVYTQSAEYFPNVYISLLFQWIVQPFLQFVLLVAASQVNSLRNNKRLIFIAIVDLAVEMLIYGGGRRTIIMFLLQLYIFYRLRNPFVFSTKIKKDLRKVGIALGAIVILYVIITITSQRLTRMGVGESFFQYYVGPFIFFDNVTESLTSYNTIGQMTYGQCFFSFIIVPFNIIRMILGAGFNESEAQILNGKLDIISYIGKHSVHNAHATSLVYFCKDFGFVFSFLGMMGLGIILAYFTKRYMRNNRALVLGVYFACLAFYSAQTYPFTGIIQYMFILYSIVFIKNEHISR